jgi:hypothetical protein
MTLFSKIVRAERVAIIKAYHSSGFLVLVDVAMWAIALHYAGSVDLEVASEWDATREGALAGA